MKVKTIAFCLLAFAAVEIISLKANAQQFEVEGHIQQGSISGNGKAYEQTSNEFRVYVNGCAWLIRTVQLSQGKPVGMWETGSTNGQEVFQLATPIWGTDAPATLSNSTRKGAPVPHRQAIIFSNDAPAGCSEPAVSHLWLMFASHCFFEGRTNPLVTPVYDVVAGDMYNKNLKLRTTWQRESVAPHLPVRVTYFNEGRIYFQDENNRPTFGQLDPPYNQGYTDAVYYASGFTNAGEMRLPLGFVFEKYMPGQGRSAEDLRLLTRAVATVSVVRPGCSLTNLLPAMPQVQRTVIVDRRLAHANPPVPVVVYNEERTLGQWPPAEEVKAIQHSRSQSETVQKRSPLIVILFCLALVAPIVVVCLRRKSNQRDL